MAKAQAKEMVFQPVPSGNLPTAYNYSAIRSFIALYVEISEEIVDDIWEEFCSFTKFQQSCESVHFEGLMRHIHHNTEFNKKFGCKNSFWLALGALVEKLNTVEILVVYDSLPKKYVKPVKKNLTITH